MVKLRPDRVGLGYLLAHQPLALEHVEEIGVATEVELVHVLDLHSAVAEEAGENAVNDGGTDLRLDVVADDRQTGLDEPLVPVVLASDEDRHAVDHGAASGQDLLGVPTGGFLAADGKVVDDDVG